MEREPFGTTPGWSPGRSDGPSTVGPRAARHSDPRAIEVQQASPLTGPQQERLIRLLATGLERYLRSRHPLSAPLDFPGELCAYDHRGFGNEESGD